MRLKEVQKVRRELEKFLAPYQEDIGRSDRMRQCGLYVSGLLLDGERKSIQPMASRLPGAEEQNLQQFVNQSPWEHEGVQKRMRREMEAWGGGREGVLILDDTTLPKKGKASAGVGPQYCGALGKIANCQCLVSWHYAGKKGHWPMGAELYLPKGWRNRKRAKRAGIPKDRLSGITKSELALKLLKEIGKEAPHRAVVFDAWYGENKAFREELDRMGEHFVGAIPRSQSFWSAEVKTKRRKNGRSPRSLTGVADGRVKPRKAEEWGRQGDWAEIRLKTSHPVKVLAKAFRVRETNQSDWRYPKAERWLIVEKESSGRMGYYVSNFPVEASLEEMVLTAHERWKVEQGYQRLKEELGLDHFEGRSWRGLHHHVTLCFLAYGFLLRTGRALKKTDLRSRSFGDGSTASYPLAGVIDAEPGPNGAAGLSSKRWAVAAYT